MNLREKEFKLEMPYENIKPFEEKVLTSGLCDFAIPMSFSFYNNKRNVIYDCSGYASIRELKPETNNEVFEILEKTLITLNKTTEFLIRSNRVELSVDTVYYNLKRKDVKIAFVPIEVGTLQSHLIGFVKELKLSASEETCEYLDCIIENLELFNQNIAELLLYVRNQRRNIHRCGI